MEFEAGKYWIGDPCYAVKDENWEPLLKKSNFFAGDGIGYWHGEYNGQIMFAAGTAYGDGSYQDNEGKEYGVDAGLLSIIPLEACDGDSMDGGHVVEFKDRVCVEVDEGVFSFGHIKIDTTEGAEDEDDYCSECGQDYDYCTCMDDDYDDYEEEE